MLRQGGKRGRPYMARAFLNKVALLVITPLLVAEKAVGTPRKGAIINPLNAVVPGL